MIELTPRNLADFFAEELGEFCEGVSVTSKEILSATNQSITQKSKNSSREKIGTFIFQE